MPHLVEATPSPTGPATAGIGTHTLSSPPTPDNATHAPSAHILHSSPLSTATVLMGSVVQSAASDSEFGSQFDSSDDISDLSGTDAEETDTEVVLVEQQRRKRKKRDYFSILPSAVLQAILARLPPFQMLVISELSRTFYNFVVLGQEMNEVWFKLVKTEEAEIKKRLEWFKLKKLEQEHRSVQMMRSFSNSSTSSNMSSSSYGGYGDENGSPISKQAKRLLVKKQEASGKTLSSGTTVKVMKRADRKKNWCKIYVDTILRGNGEDPLEPLSQVGPSKKPEKFQTIVLNEPLPQEHIKDFRAEDMAEAERKDTREARTQAKIEKRLYYKHIRSKPRGKKGSEADSGSAKMDKFASWRQPEWVADQQDGAEFY